MYLETEFQPPDPQEEPADDKWDRWFAQQEKNGYAVLSHDEWGARLDEAARDGYAEGRKDESEQLVAAPVAWLDPNAKCVNDAFHWRESYAHTVPVYRKVPGA
jgi:hypothetical protein